MGIVDILPNHPSIPSTALLKTKLPEQVSTSQSIALLKTNLQSNYEFNSRYKKK
ncbi:hypothetical protein FRB94_012719 [Tulasnella sp. JGI-2019a]|nr:hypothetical protein FRB94_012719 [Tulasnella sp. JGI-2019a]